MLANQGWNVIAIVKKQTKSGRWVPCNIIPGKNIVTNDGDIYYAQISTSTTVTDDFAAAGGRLRLGTGTTAVTKTATDLTTFITGATTALESTYPLVNDADGDNTGAGVDVASWKYAYTTGDFNNSAVAEGAIVDNATPTAALTHFLFASTFNKTSTNTLTVFINHTFNGV